CRAWAAADARQGADPPLSGSPARGRPAPPLDAGGADAPPGGAVPPRPEPGPWPPPPYPLGGSLPLFATARPSPLRPPRWPGRLSWLAQGARLLRLAEPPDAEVAPPRTAPPPPPPPPPRKPAAVPPPPPPSPTHPPPRPPP